MQAKDNRLPLQQVKQEYLNKGIKKISTTLSKLTKENNVEAGPIALKKKREKLSSLCKTPPSTIKVRGKDFRRGICLGEV